MLALTYKFNAISGDSGRHILTITFVAALFEGTSVSPCRRFILSTKLSERRAYFVPVMSHTRGEYASLPQDDDEGHQTVTGPSPQSRGQCDSDHDSAPVPANRPSNDVRATSVTFSQRLIRWSMLFIITCTVIDAMALAYLGLLSVQNALSHRSGNCAAAAAEEADLEMRSTYINFDRLYGKGSTLRPTPHAPIVNHVLAVAHISQARPHAVITRKLGGGMTINGYVPLDARRLWVTDDVSPRLPI